MLLPVFYNVWLDGFNLVTNANEFSDNSDWHNLKLRGST